MITETRDVPAPRRRVKNALMLGLLTGAAVVATLPLLLIVAHLIELGFTSVQWSFFTTNPKAMGETGGGIANGIAGTALLVAMACLMGLPIGIGAGLYLAEYRGGKLSTAVKFLSDVLNGLPSIVMGIFAWQLLVRPVGHFSALAGAVALAAMMIPLVTRTTEEMIRTVPGALREAALALGYSQWRTSLTIVLRTALPGIATGALVAIARIAGETAPLLFTALGNQYWSLSPFRAIAALPLQIYDYAKAPYDDLNHQAFAGSLILLSMMLAMSVVARIATRSRYGGGHGG